jgi:hypothetical protein
LIDVVVEELTGHHERGKAGDHRVVDVIDLIDHGRAGARRQADPIQLYVDLGLHGARDESIRAGRQLLVAPGSSLAMSLASLTASGRGV